MNKAYVDPERISRMLIRHNHKLIDPKFETRLMLNKIKKSSPKSGINYIVSNEKILQKSAIRRID